MSSSIALPFPQSISTHKGVWLAMLSAVGFSAKAIFVKLAYQYHIDPITLLTLRMLCALPFFLWMALRDHRDRGYSRFGCSAWLGLIVLGLLGYYLASVFDFIGLQYISSALERLVLYLYPTFVLLFSVWFFRRQIRQQDFAALLLCYAGIGLAVMHDWREALSGQEILIGVLWVLACAVSYALYLVGAGELVKRLGAIQMAAWAGIVSTLAIVVHFLVSQPLSNLIQPLPVYGYALAMGTISTVLPVVLMNEAMRMIGANRMAMVSTLGPMVTLILGWWFLGEALSMTQMMGATLVVGGVIVVNLKELPSFMLNGHHA